MKKTAEVIVIGAGIVGNATAYYLAKNGVDVIVLEASESIGHEGSSRCGGGVRQSGRDVRELPYAIYGIQNLWPNLSEELGIDVEYHQSGNLRLALNEEHIKILQNLTQKAQNVGLDVKMISANEVKAINPHLSEQVVGASWCPTDGHANPMKATLAYYVRARALGATFITGECVVELKKIKGKLRQVVCATGDVFEAENIILAAGFQSKQIAKTVGINLPMFPVFGSEIVTEAQPKLFDQMLGVANAEIYGHQCEHGSFVFGCVTGTECATDIDLSDQRIASTDVSANCRGIMKYVPVLKDAKIVRGWGGWMDMTPDAVPIMGKVEEVPGLILATGMNGHGFGTGPAVGLMMSQLVLGEKLVCDISPLHYDRFKTSI